MLTERQEHGPIEALNATPMEACGCGRSGRGLGDREPALPSETARMTHSASTPWAIPSATDRRCPTWRFCLEPHITQRPSRWRMRARWAGFYAVVHRRHRPRSALHHVLCPAADGAEHHLLAIHGADIPVRPVLTDQRGAAEAAPAAHIEVSAHPKVDAGREASMVRGRAAKVGTAGRRTPGACRSCLTEEAGLNVSVADQTLVSSTSRSGKTAAMRSSPPSASTTRRRDDTR